MSAVLPALLFGGVALAAEPEEEVVVTGPGSAAPAAITLDRADVVAFPATSADALLRALPGLHASAHGGRGKAFQYFVRGFDAMHGADVAVDVEGIPLNEPSNVHGHGYLDVHLLPLALVRGLTLEKGSARASVGDFGVAASASYAIGLDEPGATLQIGAGTDRSGRALATWRPREAPTGTFVVAEVEGGMGVGARRDYRQLRVAAGVERWVGHARLRAFALGYDGAFGSPGVLREDDVARGVIGFWGAYPTVGGGRSSRALLGADWTVAGARSGGRLLVWGGARALRLDQDFTGFYHHPEQGDGVRQRQQGGGGGLRAQAYWRPVDARAPTLRAGLDLRVDRASQRVAGIRADGSPWETRREGTVTPVDVGVWAEAPWQPSPWLHVLPGGRVGWLATALRDSADAPSEAVRGGAPVAAPRLVLTLGPAAPARLVVAAGRGFRSAEALGVADGGRLPITVADTAEAAVHVAPSEQVEVRAGAFATHVSNEIVFDPTAARFLATGATRRRGVEVVATARPVSRLRAQAEVTYTDGRYATTGTPIPYAPRWLVSLGAYTDALPWGSTQWTAGLRGWFLGARPLPGGFLSRPAWVVDATTRVSWRKLSLDVELDNLLARPWRDGEFVYPSHFDTTQPRSEIPARHFTAGAPFAARLAVGWRFL